VAHLHAADPPAVAPATVKEVAHDVPAGAFHRRFKKQRRADHHRLLWCINVRKTSVIIIIENFDS